VTSLPVTTAPVREIAVLRALALGDLLCAIPVLRVLRARHPEARVTLIGLPGAREVVRRFPRLIDELWPFPGFPSIPEVPLAPAATTAFLLAAQGRRFDLAVGLQGSGLASNAFLALLGARHVVGFMPPGIGTPPGPGTWLSHDPHGSEIRRLLRISPALGGIEPDGPPDERLELPALPADDAELRLVPGVDRLLAQEYAVVHPGSADPHRRWPAERFAAVARALVGRGLGVAVTGSAGERDVAAAVAAAAGPDAVDASGRTTLGALAALVDGARVVVTNDTGVSHVAAARRSPSVVLFTTSERERWAPLDADLHLAIGQGMPGACSHDDGAPHRCLGDSCTRRDACAREPSRSALADALGDGEPPSVDAVLAAVDRQLSRDRVHAG
jgi:ADP-heptose:LPS heptosyltransferase